MRGLVVLFLESVKIIMCDLSMAFPTKLSVSECCIAVNTEAKSCQLLCKWDRGRSDDFEGQSALVLIDGIPCVEVYVNREALGAMVVIAGPKGFDQASPDQRLLHFIEKIRALTANVSPTESLKQPHRRGA